MIKIFIALMLMTERNYGDTAAKEEFRQAL
jgi:hypothetical protein